MNLFRLTDGNSTNQKSNGRALFLVALVLVWLGLSPTSQALLPPPPPDGGYPNFNTAEGLGALFNLSTGNGNTALGFNALFSNTTGNGNTATGAFALSGNTTGYENTATGGSALNNNTEGWHNTANGVNALHSNTQGFRNTAVGNEALYSNTTGDGNVAMGEQAMHSNTTGSDNTAYGIAALAGNRTGSANVAMGVGALGAFNIAGHGNTAIGWEALPFTVGNNNVALGNSAGYELQEGDNNIVIGNPGVFSESNTIRIGIQGTQTRTFIAGINGAVIGGGGAVRVSASGQLGTAPSSARFKKSIKPMDEASVAIHALKPVTFHYKQELDPEGVLQFGLVAEEVEKVHPDLVARDAKGKPYTVRYEAVNAMLLNEFLKEHRTVQELKKEIAALAAMVQKVSAQVEMSRPAPQTVVDNH
jgi:Chaperone of endosialidase